MRIHILILSLMLVLFPSCKEKITIVVASENSEAIEQFAAEELSNYLTKIYPDYEFVIKGESDAGKAIHLKVTDKIAGVPDNPEGYLVKSKGDDAYILSRGNTGLIYGVYGMLEKLGCGFFLSGMRTSSTLGIAILLVLLLLPVPMLRTLGLLVL